MYRSKSCLPYFSSVVKNVASPNLQIKKLVYIFLLHHAESEPDLALLSINTIQKSLSDQNPQVRAMALRVMSGIRVPVISQIVSLAIKKGIADMSPYVRKAAALAIPKCYRLDPNTLPQLLDYSSTLLGDRQYFVVGPAVMACLEVCPDRIDLIHKHYRSLLRKLVDMDEWGQLATLRLLTNYSRRCFPVKYRKRKKNKSKGFYDEDEDELVRSDDESGEELQLLDPDLELFLKSCRPLLSSRNSAVVVATVRTFFSLGTPDYLDEAVGPLVALLRGPQDIQQIAMFNIVAVCLVRPESFVRYLNHFLVRSTDPPVISSLKFEVMTLIYSHCDSQNQEMILCELEHFTRATSPEIVRESVRAMGRCAQIDVTTSRRCLSLLLRQLSSQDGDLIAESVTVIRHLIQQDPQSHFGTVVRLAKNLDTTTNAQARASIIWLVGEFAGMEGESNVAPDVLRILAKGFSDESEAVKLQIVLLAAKVYLHHLLSNTSITSIPEQLSVHADSSIPLTDVQANGWDDNQAGEEAILHSNASDFSEHPIPLLWAYVLHLSRYDTSYDLRDRTRLYRALLADSNATQLASLLLLAPKPVPQAPSPSESRQGLLIGSSSLVVGAEAAGQGGLVGYADLPPWVEEGQEPDPKLRDEGTKAGKVEYDSKREVPAAQELDRAVAEKGLGTGVGKADKSLDDWLAEEESEEEGSTEEEMETESEADSEEEEEESSEGEEENDRLVRS